MSKMTDIAGEKFNSLTAIKYVGKNKHGQPMYEFICDCGKTIITRVSYVKIGHTKSCGCLKIKNTKIANTIHGQARNENTTREYVAWQEMKKRCTNKELKAYKDYGGRGISVCEKWLNSFEEFYKDMGSRPSKYHSLDRIDNNGNYEPNNCRWATKIEQASNCRSNHWIEYNNEKHTIAQWSRIFETKPNTIIDRVRKNIPLSGIIKKKILLNMLTGIYYFGVKDAAFSEGKDYYSFYYLLKMGKYNHKYTEV